MIAVVDISGKQYSVKENEELRVPKLDTEVGKSVAFDKVYLINDEKKVSVGNPTVKNASVAATVLDHGKDKKIIVFKKKRRKDYRRKNGHRQDYSVIKIDTIKAK